MAQPGPPMDADAREARIAELRARRRARLRYLAARGSLVAAALTLAVAALLYWLLATIAGRDALLVQVQRRLPADAQLSWERAEGPVAGPLVLYGVHFRYVMTDKDGRRDPARPRILEFSARRVLLDPALRPLLGRQLRLDALELEDATLEVPESDEPFELPRWPESLPDIRPPLSLRADTVRADGFLVTREGRELIDIRRLRGGLRADTGRLRLEHLDADTDRGRFALHGDYAPRDRYRMDLVATAVLPAAAGNTPPRLGLVARGDLDRLDVGLAGRTPAPLRASLTVRDARNPHWRLRADTEALDLDLLTRATAGTHPLAVRLAADGIGGSARLTGALRRGDFALTVQPSQVRLENQVLDLQPLTLGMFDGTVSLRGHADFNDPQNASLRADAVARGLRWGGAKQATGATPAIVADADLAIAGTLADWTANGSGTLQRDGERAQLQLDGRGDASRLTLRSLRARMPTGELDAHGDVTWDPALAWQLEATLAGFDPGYFAPAWSGALRGTLGSRGQTRADGGLEVAVELPRVEGRLRGRALQADGRFTLHGAASPRAQDAYEGEVNLALGGSRLVAKGAVAAAIAIDARFEPLQLADLVPDGAGSVHGTLRVSGPRDAPQVEADLTGSGLQYADYRAQSASVRGRLPWRGNGGALAVRGSGLALGLPLESLSLDASGAVENLSLQGDAHGAIGALSLAGQVRRQGRAWQGTLASLRLAPTRGAAWQLQRAAQFRWDGRSGALSPACLVASTGGSLCANADWPRGGLELRGEALPLALAQPYLPTREDGRPWWLRGDIALTASVRPVGRAWHGQAHVSSSTGGLRLNERTRTELVNYRDLDLRVELEPHRVNAALSAVLNENGRVQARLATGWDAYAPLDGDIVLDTDALTWIELFSPDIVDPKGHLQGNVHLAGTRAQPLLGGTAHLSGFSTELPALAIGLQDGDARLEALPDGTARITGQVRSGEGLLNVDGTLGWRGEDTPLVLNVRGENVLVSDTHDLRAVAAPDVQVRYAARQPLRITGTVSVPSARMDLERLDEGVSASPDVVVLDPVDPQRDRAMALDMDLGIVLGKDVRLSGFGLDGAIAGELRVRARPGREMTASGRLDVDGTYRAYGQKLDITRGELVWSNGPVADPLLNIRAEREVGEVTAGVDVTGRASAPQARVWSNPASSQSEALSYLALGRPLSSVTSDESRQLNAASAALSAGGSLLASQLGAKIGLDDAGVMQSRALGASVFGVGKYLSPKLYVGYGVSLVGTGQVLTLKYLLRKGFDVEIESSTLESRASINWRKEK